MFNALESAGTPLLAADRSPPGRLGLELPDLASRLASGPVLRLAVPGEDELERVLVARARERGFDLSPQVAGYLVTRERRDVRHLLALLDRLDRHSLAARRAVTIPFVRALLEDRGARLAAASPRMRTRGAAGARPRGGPVGSARRVHEFAIPRVEFESSVLDRVTARYAESGIASVCKLQDARENAMAEGRARPGGAGAGDPPRRP